MRLFQKYFKVPQSHFKKRLYEYLKRGWGWICRLFASSGLSSHRLPTWSLVWKPPLKETSRIWTPKWPVLTPPPAVPPSPPPASRSKPTSCKTTCRDTAGWRLMSPRQHAAFTVPWDWLYFCCQRMWSVTWRKKFKSRVARCHVGRVTTDRKESHIMTSLPPLWKLVRCLNVQSDNLWCHHDSSNMAACSCDKTVEVSVHMLCVIRHTSCWFYFIWTTTSHFIS